MSRRLFVYYRVAEARAMAVAVGVRREQAALCAAHAGLSAELLQRPPSGDGQRTFMEVYAGLPVDAALGAEVERRLGAALAGQLAGERHVEVFEPVG